MTYRSIVFAPLLDEAWPGEFTEERSFSRFTASWTSTFADLQAEVDKAGHGGVLEVPFSKGQLYNDGSGVLAAAKAPRHPGVALSFVLPDGSPIRFATDRYDGNGAGGYLPGWQANVRALCLTLEALRSVERHGAVRRSEQYRGFSALGDGTPMGSGAMSDAEAARFLIAVSFGPESTVRRISPEDVKQAYRAGARRFHPDSPHGDADLFRQLTEARDLLIDRGYAG